jgi:membrane protein required for colicin V production
LSYLVSFLLVFLGTLVGLSIVGRLVYHLFRISGLTAMDRFFGAIFGLARALILILVLVLVLVAIPFSNYQCWRSKKPDHC